MAATRQYLDFEKPVIELEEQILRIRASVESGDESRASEMSKLERKLKKVREEVYGSLTAYQRVQLSRSSDRVQTQDVIEKLITGFVELHGDRLFGDDPAIIGGIGKFQDRPVMVVGHQRGRTTQERVKRNFGMTQPEGNRKAQRLFTLAEKFNLPLLLFIDTQGAFPGLEAEERGQAEAIAKCLQILAGLRTPIISTVLGEGGSGGALALGVCDRLLMLENSIFSVISPEGCAAILWKKKDPAKVVEYTKIAADSLKLTAQALAETNLVDEVVKEPGGGAHRDPDSACEKLAQAIARHLKELTRMPIDEMLTKRYERNRRIGPVKE